MFALELKSNLISIFLSTPFDDGLSNPTDVVFEDSFFSAYHMSFCTCFHLAFGMVFVQVARLSSCSLRITQQC